MRARLEFHGSAREYFGIWITNVLLTLLTLGFYSPWATVRRRRYLYGSTCLLGSPMAYHARPTSILIGRTVAVFLLLFIWFLFFYLGLESGKPEIWEALFSTLLVLLVPLLVVLAQRFMLRNASWRQLRFAFKGDYRGTFIPYCIWPLLAAISLGLLLPLARFRQLRYITASMCFCGENFSFKGRLLTLYKFYVLAFGAAVLIVLMYVFLLGSAWSAWWIGLSVSLAVLMLFLAIYAAELRYRYSNTSFGAGIARFGSDIRIDVFIWIAVTNLLAVICTLGMAIPWAAVRMLRYRLAHIYIDYESDARIEQMIGRQGKDTSAIGAEVVEGLDIDMGIGW